MTALTFTLKNRPQYTLDVSPLTPDRLAGKQLDSVKKIKLAYGKEIVNAGELFDVKGRRSDDIIFEKSCDKLVCIGQGMTKGSIRIKGDVGNFAGKRMTGGELTVYGNTGSWSGNSMTGGRIEITGNAGDYVGAGQPGDAFGMSNGMINIRGNAGERVGDRMRRGIIIVQGKAGDYCGNRIHAGTIIILDKVGKYPGCGMRRGTLILAKKPAHIAATFKNCGDLKMQFLRLLFTQLANTGGDLALFRKYGPVAHRFSGDLSRNGKGEILLLKHLSKHG